ncbi:Cyclic nucleotide-gated ion channel 17 [Bienertia sinuspersici]
MANKINSGSLCKVLDPSSEFIVQWNILIFAVGLTNFYLDPMFTILLKFCMAVEDPGSRIFKRRRLIEKPGEIAINYLRSNFILDFLAILPLPQICLWRIMTSSTRAITTAADISAFYGALFFIFWFQFLPRLLLMLRSKTEISKTTGIIMKSAMEGAFYNLLLFMNLSNVVGSIYYQFSFTWVLNCKMIVREKGLEPNMLGWHQLLSNCTGNNGFEQGMISSALTNQIVSRNFFQRYMFCFSWGLKSLSSLGQNITTSFSTSETSLSICITLLGLIFFADLVVRMQAGIQTMEEKEEQQRARQREVKEWMDYHQLPLNLKERVDHAIQLEWTENGVDDEAMLDLLPVDLRSEIRKYLYLDSVSSMPKFANMDAPLMEAICQHVKTFCSKEGTYIVYEGDIVKQMLFIFSGQLEVSFTDRGNSTVAILGAGECCGQELVTWASQPRTSMDDLPSSTWTIKCLTDVEAFVLQAYDMKILATQFAHNQDFQRAFKQHYP